MSKKKVIVIGGGTAGLLIAENLKNVCDVVLIEKSDFTKTPFLNRIPLLIGLLYRKKTLKYINKIHLLVQKGREIPFFESRILGGASVINGCVHALGSQSTWENELERFSLDFNDIFEAHEKIYTKNIYSYQNKIKLRYASHNALDCYFYKSLENLGFCETDLLVANHIGFGKIINTAGVFFRSSVLSLVQNKKFKIYTGECVTYISKTENEQFIVSTTHNNFVSDYVILCAGVIGTNKLLLKNKIHGIDDNYIKDQKVGRNVKDHSNVRVNVRSSKPLGSLNEINQSFFKKICIFTRHLFGFKTLLIGTGATSGIHLDIDGDGIIDTRINLLQFSETGRHKSDGKDFSPHPGFSLSITPIQTRSSGSIIVDEYGEQIISPGYFSEKADLDRMVSALLFCMNLLETNPLNQFVEEIEDYDLIRKSPEEYIMKTFFSGHHLIGGCANLIDENFEIKNKKGIFVCDASIFSDFVSSNIHGPVILVAKLFSKRFIQNVTCEPSGGHGARI